MITGKVHTPSINNANSQQGVMMALSKLAQSIKIRDFHQFKTEKASWMRGEASPNETNKQTKQTKKH